MSVVQETPGVCGGYPCVGDRRLPVRLIVEARRKGCNRREIALLYDLSPDDVDAVMVWYLAHPERVDADIARHASADGSGGD